MKHQDGFQLPRTLKESVYATIAFFDIFDFPLTLREIHRYLLGVRTSEKELFDFLEKEEKVDFAEGYYFMKGRRGLVKVRRERLKIAHRYWHKVKTYLPWICLIPYVRMVAVCNTLAFDNPTKESDIDLFIITAKGRLFLVRTLTTILFSLLGVRRHNNKISERFCLSFFISEEALVLKNIQRGKGDIYFPYWFMTLKPLYGKKMFEDFMTVNSWLRDYFPGGILFDERKLWKERAPGFFAKLQEYILNLGFGSFLEKRLEQWHIKRHKKNAQHLGDLASVVVNGKMLKFHNIDRRDEFAQKFQERLASLLMC